jgi:hypothetical protein
MISLCEVNLNLNKFQIIYEYLVKNFTIMMQKEDKTVKTRSADLIYVRFAHPYTSCTHRPPIAPIIPIAPMAASAYMCRPQPDPVITP